MSGIREVSKQVKLYAFINGVADSVFVLRVTITEENGVPLFVDLDHLKQDIITRLPSGKTYDAQSLMVYPGNDISGPVILNPSDLIAAFKKDLTRIKLAANVQVMPSYMLDDAKQISPPPLRPEDVEPGQPQVVVPESSATPVSAREPEMLKGVAVSPEASTVVLPEPEVKSVPAVAGGKLEQSVVLENDFEKKISSLSLKLQEITKERDECLLYVQLLQSENQRIKSEFEEKQQLATSSVPMQSTAVGDVSSANANSEALARIEAQLPSLSVKSELNGVGVSIRAVDARISSVEDGVAAQAQSLASLSAGVERVNEAVANCRQDVSSISTLVAESGEMNVKYNVNLLKTVKDCVNAVQRTSEQITHLSSSLAEIKESISSSNHDLEQRLAAVIEDKLSHAVAKYVLNIQAQASAALPILPPPSTTSLSRQTSLEPESPAPPMPTKLTKAESTIPVETTANPKARVEMFESKSDLKTPPQSVAVDVEDEVPEDDEEPTDSGFRIVSLPKPVDNSASELAKSLTASQIRYAPQLAELETMGFKVRSLNSLLLNMHNGDMAKVVAELQKLQKQHVSQ